MRKIASTALLAATFVAPMAHATVVTINDPSPSASYYVNPKPSPKEEIHVIGIYQTQSDGPPGRGHPLEGTAFVTVTGTATAPINLVLSSYEPTNWVIRGDGLNFIDTVLINGRGRSRVTGVDASLVVNKTGPGKYFAGAAYAWPDSTGVGNTPALVKGVEKYFCSPITSFSGAYQAASFSVQLSAVPEPGMASLWLLGAGGLWAARRARRA